MIFVLCAKTISVFRVEDAAEHQLFRWPRNKDRYQTHPWEKPWKKHENQRFLSRIISFIDCGVSMSVVSSRVDWLNILLWLAGCHFSYLEKTEKTCVPLSILIRKMNDETCKLKLYWCYWYDMIPFGIIMDQSEHKISVLCMEHHI